MATITIDHTLDILQGISDLRFLTRAVWEAIGEEIKISTQERFDREESPSGERWAPLSPRYAEKKRAQDYGDKILNKRGHLRNLLRYEATDYELRFGSDRPYAAIHQFGGDFKAWGSTPRTCPNVPTLVLTTRTKPPSKKKLPPHSRSGSHSRAKRPKSRFKRFDWLRRIKTAASLKRGEKGF